MSVTAAPKLAVPAAAAPSRRSPARSRMQTRLTVNRPGDAYEREADSIADAVIDRGGRGTSPAALSITHGGPALHRKCACGSGGMSGSCDACKDEALQRKGAHTAPAPVAPPLVHTVLDGPGRPLADGTRRFMESRLGRDFGNVRVHADAQAAESARQVGGLAYTVGSHIVFGTGRYAPGTREGDRLIAHELVHTLQQRGAEVRLQRACYDDECDVPAGPAPSPLSADTSAEAFTDPGWRNVQELGIAYKEGPESEKGGANLRASPNGQLIEWMPHNTKVFVLKAHDAWKMYAVTRIDGAHTFGYVSQDLIKLHLPDPQARIVKVKPGDTSLKLVQTHYRGRFNDAWKADERYAVNALYWANAHQRHKTTTDDPAIEKKDTWVERKVGPFSVRVFVRADSDDAPWETVQVYAGRYLWLPGEEFLRSLYAVVREKGGGTGSIKAEAWQTVKGWYDKGAYAIAFVGGILHGFVKSIWDAIAGIADLLYSVLKSLLSGELISDIKDLAGSIRKMLSAEGRAAVGEAIGQWAAEWDAKLNDSSPWVSGHAHGYLTGYVMAEAAMLLLTFGGAAALKGALWGSRLGTLVKGSRAVQTIEKIVAKGASVARAADARFQVAVEALKRNRYAKVAVQAAEVTAHAVVWTAQGVATALSLPGRMLSHLTEPVIDRLKQIRDLFPRIKGLSDPAKWWLFGCHSPCRVNTKAISRTLDNLTDAEIEAAVKVIDPKTLGPKKGAPALTAKAGAVHLDLPDVVDVARARLKAAGVSGGLPPKTYGTRLHAEVNAVLEETLGTVPKGWVVGSERRLSSLVTLDSATAKMTVRQYLGKFVGSGRYPAMPRTFLDTPIGRLTPDVFVRAPDGRMLVWDLTSEMTPQHLAKTMIYAEVIGGETGGFLRIAEGYWRTRRKVSAP